MKRRVLGMAAVALGAGSAGLLWRRWQSDHATTGANQQGPAAAGAPAEGATSSSSTSLWSQTVERVDGTPWPLSTLRGQPVIVNFWATWCPPCVREMPMLDRFVQSQRKAAKQPQWRLVGLAVDRPEAVKRFLETHPVSYEIGIASLDAIGWGRALGNASGGLPFTVAFDLRGQPLYQKLGEVSEAELLAWPVPIS